MKKFSFFTLTAIIWLKLLHQEISNSMHPEPLKPKRPLFRQKQPAG